MKRKGFLLYEMILAAAVSSAAILALAPFMTKTGQAIALGFARARLSEEAMSAEDFMTEKFRNTVLPADRSAKNTPSITYTEGTPSAVRQYAFVKKGQIIKVQISKRMSQPLTGGSAGKENTAVKDLSFYTEKDGLIRYSLAMGQEGGESYEMKTSLWPYVDFFKAL